MDAKVKNALYQDPKLYELVYQTPSLDVSYTDMTLCLRMFERFLAAPPQSILDMGSGTGRNLDDLSKICQDCVGIDYLPEMVEFAQSKYKHLQFLQGDMRRIRLHRTFDVMICMGSVLMHALSNKDLEQTFNTFAAHAHPGSLLILDIKNYIRFLQDDMPETIEKEIDTPNLQGKYILHQRLDFRKQIMIWKRFWHLSGYPVTEDYCEWRMLFPQEIGQFLQQSGFSIVGMFDNLELKQTDLTGNRLFVAAQYHIEA